MRLHDAEVKVKSLEKENVRLKEHEEFYINKAREWKSRALKYERTLQENGVPVPQPRDKRQHQEKSEVNKVIHQVLVFFFISLTLSAIGGPFNP